MAVVTQHGQPNYDGDLGRRGWLCKCKVVVSNEQTLEGSHNSLEHFLDSMVGKGGKVVEQIRFENWI
jgi:hypothetical protein